MSLNHGKNLPEQKNTVYQEEEKTERRMKKQLPKQKERNSKKE